MSKSNAKDKAWKDKTPSLSTEPVAREEWVKKDDDLSSEHDPKTCVRSDCDICFNGSIPSELDEILWEIKTASTIENAIKAKQKLLAWRDKACNESEINLFNQLVVAATEAEVYEALDFITGFLKTKHIKLKEKS